MVTPYDAVTDAGLAHDWDAGFRKRGDIPVDGSNARLEFICNFLGPRNPAPLQVNQDGNESIDPVHIA